MKSSDTTDDNVAKIAALFPQCVTETADKIIDRFGNVKYKSRYAIDFDKLRTELSKNIIDKRKERYQFTWPDKRMASQLANTPTRMTLRPDLDSSVNFWTTQNLYIEGDNLDVLKILRESYRDKIKMIYIDPPYNTGKHFNYKDDFSISSKEFGLRSGWWDENGNDLIDPIQRDIESEGRFHTDWLNMIYPRLKVARDLLSADGAIFISIDDCEVENLTKVCNEIFGEQNFIGQWNWFKSATPPNLSRKIKKNIEYIIAYQKEKNSSVFQGVKKTSLSDDPLTKPQNPIKVLMFKAGYLHAKFPDGIISPGIYGTKKFPNELLDELHIKNGVNINDVRFANKFIWVQETLDKQVASGTRINLSKSLVISYKKSGYDAEVPPNFIDDKVGVETTEKAGKYLDSLIGVKVFDYPKPVSLMAYLINFHIKKDEHAIILDFFSGSGSTAESVMTLNAKDQGNRKFIMVQLPEPTEKDSNAYKTGYETICQIGEERIRRAGEIISASSLTDVGFRVLKLDSSNMKDEFYARDKLKETNLFNYMDNVKEDRPSLDLLFQILPEFDIELSARIEEKEMEGKKVFLVNGSYLIATFDTDINESMVIEIAKMKPKYFVVRDSRVISNIDNSNEILRQYSPDTICKSL